jgi:hypothetical protein
MGGCNVGKIISKALGFASQGMTEDRSVGMPHEEALVSGFSRPELIGATLMFPSVDVSREYGEWREYGADGLQLIEGGLEMPIGATRKEIDVEVGKDTFRTVKVGLQATVFDEEQETDDYDTIKGQKLENVASGILLYSEYLVSKVVQNTSNYDSGFKVTFSTSTSRWSDLTNSDPSADVTIGCLAIEDTHEVDREEFTVGIAKDVWNYVVRHPKLQQFNNSGQKMPPTKEFLATIWGVKNVVVMQGKVSYNVGDKKDPRNWRFKRLWTNCFVVFRAIDKPNAAKPLWGARPHRKGFPQVKPPYRDNERDADVYPTNDKFGVLLRSKNRAYYADRVIS